MKDTFKEESLHLTLLEEHCVKCNLTFSDSELELDHIDPKEKTLDFARKWNVPLELYLAEVKKAQPLCKPCHIAKSIIDAGKEKAKHGSLVMYKYHKCRCELCKEANRKFAAKYKKKKKQRKQLFLDSH